jgi:hypothetical protein
MTDHVRLRDDLYVGAGEDYQRYRPAYPARLLDRLTEAAGANGHGQLVDLACGTGLVAVRACRPVPARLGGGPVFREAGLRCFIGPASKWL